MKNITWLGLIIIAIVVAFIGGYYASKIIDSIFPIAEPDIVGVASDTSGMDAASVGLSDILHVAERRIVNLERGLAESERYNSELEQQLGESENYARGLERNNSELEQQLVSSQNNTAELERLFSRLAAGNDQIIEGLKRGDYAQQQFTEYLKRLSGSDN